MRILSSARLVSGNNEAQPHRNNARETEADLMASLREEDGDCRHPTPAGSLDDDLHARKRRPQQLLQELLQHLPALLADARQLGLRLLARPGLVVLAQHDVL